jgi:hypothetical protein
MTQASLDAQAIAVPQEDLLDKAFDELTPSEWEQLKQYQPEITSQEVVA